MRRKSGPERGNRHQSPMHHRHCHLHQFSPGSSWRPCRKCHSHPSWRPYRCLRPCQRRPGPFRRFGDYKHRRNMNGQICQHGNRRPLCQRAPKSRGCPQSQSRHQTGEHWQKPSHRKYIPQICLSSRDKVRDSQRYLGQRSRLESSNSCHRRWDHQTRCHYQTQLRLPCFC